jgi:cytochrome P450
MTEQLDRDARPRLEGFDPYSDDFLRDPYPLLERARRECPVFYYPPMDFWVLTRYDDVAAAVGDHQTFSSAVWRTVPRPPEFAGRVPENLMGVSFINLDPPTHTVSRKNANRAFTRRLVAQQEPHIRQIAHETIDGFAADGACDLMQQFCYPVSLRTIVGLLGLPEADMPRFRQWTEDVFSLMTPGGPQADESTSKPMAAAEVCERYDRVAEAYAYYTAFVEERRDHPTEDLTSAMVHARDADGEPLLDTERIIVHMIELTAAGHDTTANLIGNTVAMLCETQQVDEVRRDPVLLENAVEESLRRRATSPKMFRITTRDVTLRGVRIPAGSAVCLQFGAANHDEERFPDPRRFDVHRPNADEHFAFGRGRHFCMGAPLARLEARIALEVLLERLPSITVVPGQDRGYIPVTTLDTFQHLAVRWGRGEAA